MRDKAPRGAQETPPLDHRRHQAHRSGPGSTATRIAGMQNPKARTRYRLFIFLTHGDRRRDRSSCSWPRPPAQHHKRRWASWVETVFPLSRRAASCETPDCVPAGCRSSRRPRTTATTGGVHAVDRDDDRLVVAAAIVVVRHASRYARWPSPPTDYTSPDRRAICKSARLPTAACWSNGLGRADLGRLGDRARRLYVATRQGQVVCLGAE